MSKLTPISSANADSAQWDEGCGPTRRWIGRRGYHHRDSRRAGKRGAEVLLLDRFRGGGATSISGGVFYAGGGTHIQKEAGVEDTAENMYRYLAMEVQDAVSEETLRHFCETSAASVKWLTDRGVPFLANLCPVKTSYPIREYYLYYSGNEPPSSLQ